MIRAANSRLLSALRSFGRRYVHSRRRGGSGGGTLAGLAIREMTGGILSDNEPPGSNGGIGRGFMRHLFVAGLSDQAQQSPDDPLRVDSVAAGVVVGNDPMLQNRQCHVPNFPAGRSWQAPQQRQRPGAEDQTLRSARARALRSV